MEMGMQKNIAKMHSQVAMTGIEPASTDYKSVALPLGYIAKDDSCLCFRG